MSQGSENAANSNHGANDSAIEERVQELTWALLDQYASDDDIELLDTLLVADDKARETYLGCVRLHVDLMSQFAVGECNGAPGKQSPVLKFLDSGTSLGQQSSPVTDA
jgi:hypothetical protein